MTDPTPSSPQQQPPLVETLRPVAHLQLKATALLLFTLALIVGSGLYLLTGYPFSSTDINSPIFAVFSLPFRR